MAEIKITGLNSHSELQLDGNDVLPIVDVSSPETKKIAISELDKRYKEPTEELETQVDINTADIDLLKAGVIPADNSVSTDKIQNLAVTEPKIANLAVTTAKIANSNVTGPKIANQSVSVAKLASDVTDLLSPGYIVNGTAEADTSGWLVYKDAVQALPEDGSGTGASVTWTRGDTNPLRGDGHFVFTKGATNEQGEGVATDFEIENADLAKVLTISMEYTVLSGTYQSGDLTVYIIQDPDGTPEVIQPAGFSIESVSIGIQNKLIATFQTSATVKNYRLCFHVASSSADAYSLAFDSINVQHKSQLYGAPITDWVDFTPTVTVSSGTVPTFSSRIARYRRVGDSIEVRGVLTWQTATTFTSLQIQLPFGRIDSQKQSLTSAVGQTYIRDFGTGNFIGTVRTISANDQVVECLVNTTDTVSTSTTDPSVGAQITNLIPMTWAVSDELHFVFTVSVTGLGSSVVMSDSTDTRVVAFSATGNVPATAANVALVYPTKILDTHGAYNSSTGKYLIPVSGVYRFTASVRANHALYTSLRLYKNNVGLLPTCGSADANGFILGNFLHSFNAGDEVDVRATASSSATSLSSNFFSAERLSGPSAIAATETVAMRAYKNTGSHTFNGGWQTVASYNANPFDSHGAFNTTTGEYTAPVSGTYQVSATIGFAANATGFRGLRIDLDGALNVGGLLINSVSSGVIGTLLTAAGIVRANAGQKISINAYQNSGGNLNYETISNYSHLSIVRVGN